MKYTPAQLKEMARAAAVQHGLDPEMFVAQLAQESANFAPDVVAGKRKSGAGAVGVAQFMPKTAAEFKIDPTDPAQAIPAAAKYMAQLVKQFGSEPVARQAYNWGMGNLAKHLKDPTKHPMPTETREYNQHIAKRAGKTEDMAVPVFAQASPAQALQIMQNSPVAPPGGGLFVRGGLAARPKPQAKAPAQDLFSGGPPPDAAAPAAGLFAQPVKQADPLSDIFAQATDAAGTMFPKGPAFPDHFDGMIQQLLKRV